MADITMCDGLPNGIHAAECPKRESCWRHMAPANDWRQSYFMTAPVELDGSCQHFWPLTWMTEDQA